MELSGSTTTEPRGNGGQRFSSFNPDVLLTWKVKEYLQIYGEVYGQTKTGHENGSGFIGDVGIIYLLTKNLTVDFEVARRINGQWMNIDNYVGAGFGLLL